MSCCFVLCCVGYVGWEFALHTFSQAVFAHFHCTLVCLLTTVFTHDINLNLPSSTIAGVAAISFLNPKESTPSSAHFVTGTGHKHIRLYDIKASQQPSFSIDIGGEYRITSIQPTGDSNALFVGDCSGTNCSDQRMNEGTFYQQELTVLTCPSQRWLIHEI